MSFVRSRYVGALALLLLMVLVVSCASNRPPPYVYTPPPVRESVRVDDRPSAPPARSDRAAARTDRMETASSTRADTPPPRTTPPPARTRAPVTPPPTETVSAEEEPDTGRGRFFGLGARADNAPAAETPAVGDRLFDGAFTAPEGGAAYRLRSNDPLIIQLRGIPEGDNHELVVDDQGFINLPYIPPVRAEGLTPSELQRTIQEIYIAERIYRQITVNVILPTQSYFVRGEVRQPGRFPLTSGMTVLKAIAAAGGYTEFANPRRINIIRAGETIVENARQMEQNPEQDMEVKAGDVIIVPRSIF